METTVTVLDILASFDKEDFGDFTEFEITTELRKLVPEDVTEIPFEVLAESMAFSFSEGFKGKKSSWGTYFGPMYVAAGSESPSLTFVTPEMISYWEKRGYETKNPILKARYFGLVWDFSEKIKNEKPHYKIGENYVESLVSIAEKKFYRYKKVPVLHLDRALTLALKLNKSLLVDRVTAAILEYDKYISNDDMPGLWGSAFDMLVMNDKISLDDQTEKDLIDDLESKFTAVTTRTELIRRWDAESLTFRLADYYRKRGKKDDLRRVLLTFGSSLEAITKEASAMQSAGIYERIQKLYRRFGLIQEAEEILKKLRAVGKNVDSEMSSVPFEFSLPAEGFKKYLEGMLEGTNEDVLLKVTAQYIPKKEEEKQHMFKLAKEAPTLALIGLQLQDRKGRVVARVGSLEQDLEGHMIRHISQSMTFSAIFLRNVITGAIQRKNLRTEDVVEYISKSPVFTEDRKEIIKSGLDYFFADNIVVAIHLLIPQIEEAIRNIVEFAGGNVLKPKGDGESFMLKTMEEVLRDPITVTVLGEDICYYFRILFTDQRGWNMRNNVCHGIVGVESFNHQSADRVLHGLLCLGLLRKKEELS